jgi:hypothetical protein
VYSARSAGVATHDEQVKSRRVKSGLPRTTSTSSSHVESSQARAAAHNDQVGAEAHTQGAGLVGEPESGGGLGGGGAQGGGVRQVGEACHYIEAVCEASRVQIESS